MPLKNNMSTKEKLRTILACLAVWLVLVGIHGTTKPLPTNVHLKGRISAVPADSLHFFSDVTYVDETDTRHSEQEIFDEIFRMIEDANHYVLVDMFLFNDFTGIETSSYRQLSEELTETLIAKRKSNPDITMQVITDPINTMYGGHVSPHVAALQENDIPVIITDLRPLRDSNPLYSAWWRTFFQWFGNSSREGFLPNPLDADSPSLSFRTFLSIFNYKANHRKVVMADYERNGKQGLSVLTTSANPHDGSSAHSNIAVRADHALWQDTLKSERAVAQFSSKKFHQPPKELLRNMTDEQGPVTTQLLTEGAIENTIIEHLNNLKPGDSFDMAMFYIADRDIITALKNADTRGAKLRILLDPNKDAFGREKNGMPNRQVAHELMQHTTGNTKVRWCNTHGEQCHSKLLVFKKKDSQTLIQGSANLTKRNIGDLNLETNILITSTESIAVINDAISFFEKNWNNEPGKNYSVTYETYADSSKFKTLTYRFKEWSGISRW